MISLKHYLDMDDPVPQEAEPALGDLFTASMACYRDALAAIGKSVGQVSPALSADLELTLQSLAERASIKPSPKSLRQTEDQVELLLREWGTRTARHFKSKADEVKELLVALAKTAESVGNRDQNYSQRLKELTARFEKIADLDDLTTIRSSLVRGVSELKNSVDQMARESQQMLAQLRSEVTVYETRLKSVEHLILKDELTGMANRRSLEERIRWNIENQVTFCIVMVDLNHFKHINDHYGHLAGDELLKQFAAELRLNVRSSDMVGRWGGDEFTVVVSSGIEGANHQVERIREWVFGKYTIPVPDSKERIEMQVDAAVGVSEWQPGQTIEQVLNQADCSMYQDKRRLRSVPA
jgi:diguanylate cyclase